MFKEAAKDVSISECPFKQPREGSVGARMSKGIVYYEVGEQIELFLLIKNATKGIASNGKPFLTLIFQDQSGEIEAKLWDVSDEDAKNYSPETIVKVAGIF